MRDIEGISRSLLIVAMSRLNKEREREKEF